MDLFDYYDKLNNDDSHKISNDDTCTPMQCVKTMLDYVPEELWRRNKVKVLDPCTGNGNFAAYCQYKTDISNIYLNEINEKRYLNCIDILNPPHIQNGDFFLMDSHNNNSYDLIMANPPYSGGGNKNKSISKKFIEHSISLLNNFGYLCFITPNNWMSYNNNNTTLKKLLECGSFVVIDNDAKKFFPKIGSSFTIFIWQKGIYNNKTKVINNYLIKDIQENVIIPNDLKFIPLYLSMPIISIIKKCITDNVNDISYRCDLHNFTQKKFLSDTKDDFFKYETIHTARITRYASKKQDIYDKYVVIIPLSTYYIPYIMHNVNVTQSVCYVSFDNKDEAKIYLDTIINPVFKVLVHITRYGNFNNILLLKHLKFDSIFSLSSIEKDEINKIVSFINY